MIIKVIIKLIIIIIIIIIMMIIIVYEWCQWYCLHCYGWNAAEASCIALYLNYILYCLLCHMFAYF